VSAPRALALVCAATSLVVAASCGLVSDPARGVPDAGSRSFARLAVVLTAAREGGMTVGAAGRLLRYRGVDLDSAQILAGTRDRERAPLGRCAVRDDEAQLEDALATSPPDTAVQMLDAGDVLVRIAGQTVKMAPRYVPDIVPFVAGVVYDAEVASESTAETGGHDEAWIEAFGGQQVGRFVTAAELPAMPRLLTVAGNASVDAPVGVDLGADLAVTWTPADGGARGAVTLAVTRDVGPALRCRVADSGRFVIPGAALARVLDGARGDSIAISIERSRRSPFSAQGLDTAEIEVTVRDVVGLRAN
jgi:hypothetical protein